MSMMTGTLRCGGGNVSTDDGDGNELLTLMFAVTYKTRMVAVSRSIGI